MIIFFFLKLLLDCTFITELKSTKFLSNFVTPQAKSIKLVFSKMSYEPSPSSSGTSGDHRRSDHEPSSHTPALAKATANPFIDDDEQDDLANQLQAQNLQTPPPTPGPRTPGSVTKKDSMAIIYGDSIVALPMGRKPTKMEVVQLYMHHFDEVRFVL